MEIRIDIEEMYTLVVPVGEVGEKDVERIRRALQTLLRHGYDRVVLDFSEVPSVNGAVLEHLVENLDGVRFGEGDLKIVGLNERLDPLFRSMGVDSMFEINRTVIDAVARLSPMSRVQGNEATA